MSTVHTRWAVDSSILSIAEADTTIDLRALKAALAVTFHVDPSFVTLEDAQAVKCISHAIARRAARLAGMATAAVVPKSGGADLQDDGPKEINITLFRPTSNERGGGEEGN